MQNNIYKYLILFTQSIKMQCLIKAIKLEIFDLLDKNISLELISNALSLDKNTLATLLDGLVFLDLLIFDNDSYKLTEISKEFFVSSSSKFVGDFFLQRYKMLQNGSQIIGNLSQKSNFKTPQNQQKIWALGSNSIKQEQSLRKDYVINLLLSLKDFPKAGKILDLGCSSGTLILDTIKDFVDLKLVLFDYEEVIKIAKDDIRNCDFKDRVFYMSGDINKDDIGEGYDLIWCSHVFYFLDDIQDILDKIYKALKPNGIFISYHTNIDKNNPKFEDNFFYFFYLILQNRQTLMPQDLAKNLTKIGFKSITSFENSKDLAVFSQVTIARK